MTILELVGRGATLEPFVPADAVIDIASNVYASFQLAKGRDENRPGHWICVTRMGADPSLDQFARWNGPGRMCRAL